MGPFTFRNSVMEADVLPVTVKAAVKHFGIKKVAVIYGNDDAFTKSGYDVFKSTLEQQKIPVTTTEAYAKGDVDFKAQLTKIKAGNPDAIVCSCLAEEAANIILQTRALGMKQPFIGGNGLNSPKLFEIAKDAGDNTVMGSPWSAENLTPANKAFITAYKAKFGSDPDQFAAQAYDALHIVAAALKNVKLSGDLTKDRDALRVALPTVTTDGATRQVCLPSGSGRGRQASWFRCAAGSHRQHRQRRQVRPAEVTGKTANGASDSGLDGSCWRRCGFFVVTDREKEQTVTSVAFLM